jgi:hypothetical protein
MAIKFFLGHKQGSWAFYKENEVATWPTTGPVRSRVFYDLNSYGSPDNAPRYGDNPIWEAFGITELPSVSDSAGTVDVSNVRKAVVLAVPSHPLTKYNLDVFSCCNIFPESARRWSRHAGSYSSGVNYDRGIRQYDRDLNYPTGMSGIADDVGLNSLERYAGEGGSDEEPLFVGTTSFLIDVHGVDKITVSPRNVERTQSQYQKTANVANGSDFVEIISPSYMKTGSVGNIFFSQRPKIGSIITFFEKSPSNSNPGLKISFSRRILSITDDGYYVDAPINEEVVGGPYVIGSEPPASGTMSTDGTSTITGSDTKFLSEASVGDVISYPLGLKIGTVQSIEGNTSLTVDTTPSPSSGEYILQRTLDIYVGLIEIQDSE